MRRTSGTLGVRFSMFYRQDKMRVEVFRLDIQDFLGPIVRFRHEVVAKRVSEQLQSGCLDRFIEFDCALQVIVPLVQEQSSLVGGSVLGPIAIETGKFVVNRGVLGVELEGLFIVNLGLLEGPGTRGLCER